MRLGRLFIGSGTRYVLRETSRSLLQPHDFGALDLPDRLFWLYYLLRPVLWIRRALGRRESWKAVYPAGKGKRRPGRGGGTAPAD